MSRRLTVAELLEDERVRMLVNVARHAHTAMTFDVCKDTRRAAAENLASALDAFTLDAPDGVDALPPTRAAR